MGFWIFILVMVLILPFTMTIFGRFFSRRAPKEINPVFGYRTSMSMKNKDTWEFAHKYYGRLSFLCGIVEIPLSIIPMLFLIGKNDNTIGAIGVIIVFIQLIPVIGIIIPTEIALRRNFDKNGKRR